MRSLKKIPDNMTTERQRLESGVFLQPPTQHFNGLHSKSQLKVAGFSSINRIFTFVSINGIEVKTLSLLTAPVNKLESSRRVYSNCLTAKINLLEFYFNKLHKLPDHNEKEKLSPTGTNCNLSFIRF